MSNNGHDQDPILLYLHDLRTELQILNEQVRNGVLTDEMILALLVGIVSGRTVSSRLTQTSGGTMAGTLSITAGKTGTFLRSNLPVGSFGLATGTVPTYTVDDPAVTLGPDPSDPTNTDKFSAAVPATDTGASFNVTVAITPALDETGAAGTPVSNVFNVTIVPAVTPPPFVPTTASDLTQTS